MPGKYEVKFFALDVKGLDEDGTWTGYANVTEYVDSGRDYVHRGAFARTVKSSGGKFPAFAFHDPGQTIGLVYVSEDDKGLKVDKGVLNLETERGREMYAHLRFFKSYGMPMEMSIGYIPVKWDYDSDGVRHIREIKLKEVSLLPPGYAMNDRARVRAVKSWYDGRGLDPPDREHDDTDDTSPASAGFFDAKWAQLDNSITNLNGRLAALLAQLPEPVAGESSDPPAEHSDDATKSAQDSDSQPHSLDADAVEAIREWLTAINNTRE